MKIREAWCQENRIFRYKGVGKPFWCKSFVFLRHDKLADQDFPLLFKIPHIVLQKSRIEMCVCMSDSFVCLSVHIFFSLSSHLSIYLSSAALWTVCPGFRCIMYVSIICTIGWAMYLYLVLETLAQTYVSHTCFKNTIRQTCKTQFVLIVQK